MILKKSKISDTDTINYRKILKALSTFCAIRLEQRK